MWYARTRNYGAKKRGSSLDLGLQGLELWNDVDFGVYYLVRGMLIHICFSLLSLLSVVENIYSIQFIIVKLLTYCISCFVTNAPVKLQSLLSYILNVQYTVKDL